MLARFITGRRAVAAALPTHGAVAVGLRLLQASLLAKLESQLVNANAVCKSTKKPLIAQYHSYGCDPVENEQEVGLFAGRGSCVPLGHKLQAVVCRGDLCATPPPPPPLFIQWLNRPTEPARQPIPEPTPAPAPARSLCSSIGDAPFWQDNILRVELPGSRPDPLSASSSLHRENRENPTHHGRATVHRYVHNTILSGQITPRFATI